MAITHILYIIIYISCFGHGTYGKSQCSISDSSINGHCSITMCSYKRVYVFFFKLTPLTNLKNQNHHENLKTLPEKWFVYNSSQRHNNIYKKNPNTWFMTKPLDESPRVMELSYVFFGDPNGWFHGKSQSKMDALIWSMAISGSDWLEVLSIYKAYLINGLNFREYPHNIWPEKW